ncbi:23S rRNA (pseudouridine(1915)-N(3))-methyltransferase RlmH [bacterium]|nr:23S rRNA (pseudouridine(1915)-N(3))-methyltransferase RlmH [bacterium]
MPAVHLITVGKLKNKALKEVCEDYAGRLTHYISFKIIEVKDSKAENIAKRNEEEALSLLEHIDPADQVIGLDVKGKEYTTENFSSFLNQFYSSGKKKMVFVIGGSYGLGDSLKKRANGFLSLSALTMPHELARTVFLEQLYRAHTLLKGEKYHH